MAQLLGLDARDRLMIVLPLFCGKAQFSVAMALASGASILLERGFFPSSFWSVAREGGATQVSLSGSQLWRLYAMRPRRNDANHSIRKVLTIGTPARIHEAFEHRFGLCVVEAWGLETAGFATVNPVERGRRKLGTAGLPVPWCEVAVLDERMRPLETGAVGAIWVRPRNGSSNGPWLRSKDLGRMDEEGFLTVANPHAGILRQGRGGESRWR
jgi:acyl-CoA synthetase (AMP-forming)/AMP-acid ligase II